jgi:hypothetical protein
MRDIESMAHLFVADIGTLPSSQTSETCSRTQIDTFRKPDRLHPAPGPG